MQQLPDLRQDKTITVEHFSVLQERLGHVLDDAYPGDKVRELMSNHVSPEWMKTEILEMFTPDAFLALFQTELGKGLILGSFIQKHIFGEGSDEEL